jgi:phospholipid/cholesterol/gamma-HCH transport system substrate-binding protein
VRTTSSLVKLVLFAAATIAAFGMLALTIHPIAGGRRTEYKAVLADASGLAKGDDVRIAGVPVGRVKDIGLSGRSRALLTLDVDADHPLTDTTQVVVRYRNLIGQRYVALVQGAGAGSPLAAGATIPLARTQPALDLTVLFNGFKPLFAALSPQDVNQLSGEIIQVLQGEGGTINSLLAHTASLTSSVADRDEVIGRTISNLNAVLGTVDSRDDQLDQLLVQLQRFVSGLSADRVAIGSSLTSINGLAADTAGLLSQARPPLKADIANLAKLSRTLNKPANTKTFEHFMDTWPGKVNTLTRTATYGSWFNFYLCKFDGSVVLPTGALGLTKDTRLPVNVADNKAARCGGVG